MGYRLTIDSCNPTASIASRCLNSFKMPHKLYASAASEVSNSLNAFKVYSTVSRNRRMVYTQNSEADSGALSVVRKYSDPRQH